MAYSLTVLGCHSATPRLNAQPTAQHLNIREHAFLIDCGEGTQTELKRYKLRSQRINHIFISHLHGDHFFGLLGLISSYHLLDRGKELHLHAPEGIRDILNTTFRHSNTWLSFPLHIHPLRFDASEIVLEDEKVSVRSFPLKHSVPACGFVFREQPHPRKLQVEAVRSHNIPVYAYQRLKEGSDWKREDGSLVSNGELTLPGPVARAYAFCSDTAFDESIAPWVEGVDWLYHEATFLESEAHLAEKTRHSTAAQAARLAAMAGVKNLLMGHYSARYKELEALRQEGMKHFDRVHLAEDGMRIDVH